VRTLHNEDDVGGTRRGLSANDGHAAAQHAASYKVYPTDPTDVVIAKDGSRELPQMRWGRIPRWWNKSLKEAKIATFNARVERLVRA
jgi:putative SOS response-associated peptidase YedK